jgi:DNA polymerase/3'-5' exonuclease PolX
MSPFWCIEARDIIGKKFAKSSLDSTQLEITHPNYHGAIMFEISGIQIDPSNKTRCFVTWDNITASHWKENWFPFNLRTSENIDDLECSFPDYHEKIVYYLPSYTTKKRRFDDMIVDDFANKNILDQINSIMHVYSFARSLMDQHHYLSLAMLMTVIHGDTVQLENTYELQEVVRDMTEHDNVAREFLLDIVTHFIQFGDNVKKNDVVLKRLKTIHGIGDVRAAELSHMGIQDVNDLRQMISQKHDIVPQTIRQILPFHEDLQKPIPRMEVETIAGIVQQHGQLIWDNLHIEILGSFSRGAMQCGDVDILITSPSFHSMSSSDYVSRIDFLHRLTESLKSTGVLVQTMRMTPYPKSLTPSAKGSAMFMGIVKVAGVYRHIDIKVFPHSLLSFCKLHFIGNYRFNKALRWYTNKKGYRLSELGLRRIVSLDSSDESDTELEDDLVREDRIERIQSEQDIFYALRLKYIPPTLRQLA